MKPKTRLFYSSVLAILGAIIAGVAGLMAEEHPIGDMPALVSVLGLIGLISFFAGVVCIAMTILFSGGEE